MRTSKNFPSSLDGKNIYIVLAQFVYEYGAAGATYVSAVYDDIDKAYDRCKALKEDGYLSWISVQHINDEGD